MRDILGDLEAGEYLSDPDPVRRAQIQMKMQLPKRFYNEVSVSEEQVGFAIRLDGRPIRSPGKALLALPTKQASMLVASEFEIQEDVIDPTTMPVLRLANTAIDGVAMDPKAVLKDILRFAASDMICYRADTPQGLVKRQNKIWDPVLDWFESDLGARFNLAQGVIHIEQPTGSFSILETWLTRNLDPFRLAALHVMTSLTGSALLALATEAGELNVEDAWTAAHVDEDWQIEQWGQDAEALARRSHRKLDFLAATKLLLALQDQ